MRVLWLSPFVPYPPTGLGAPQRSYHLLREASKRHEIHLAALCLPNVSTSADTARAIEALSGFIASVHVFRLPVDHHHVRRAVRVGSALLRRISYCENALWSTDMDAYLRRITAQLRFDVVHLDGIGLARYIRAVPGIPVVLNHHNIESHLLSRRADAERTTWGRWLYRREANKVEARERELAPRAAINLVVSDLDGARLRGLATAARTTTVANGVDVQFFRAAEGVTPAPRSMVFAGRLDWLPNRDAVLFFISEIWPALLIDNPDRRMTIVGKDPPAQLLAAARDPRLRAPGFVDDLRPYLEEASIYVCPLRVGGGTRLKILDALAMSRPVVSTEVGVEGLGLVDGRHYLRADTVSEFVSQIKRLETDRALRVQLGRAGRELVEQRFSWELIGESLDRAYDAASRRGTHVSVGS
jgi:sugar transferase (PEP-CTERM/EpsH1 system associated)